MRRAARKWGSQSMAGEPEQPWIVQFNVDIPGELKREVVEYCAKNGVLKRVIVELALRRFLVKESEDD